MSLSFSDWAIYSTVRIETTRPNGGGLGTGFFVDFASNGAMSVPCLVTNKHVVAGGTDYKLYIKVNAEDEKDYTKNHMFECRFSKSDNYWVWHENMGVDLVALPTAVFFEQCRAKGFKPVNSHYFKDLIATDADFKDLTSIENILMVGYPIGLWDHIHNNPIARRGITATPVYNDFQGKKEFLIDCACFPGSSGSPVL